MKKSRQPAAARDQFMAGGDRRVRLRFVSRHPAFSLVRCRGASAFTLIEVLVSVAITALIGGIIVAIVGNVSGFWSRTSGRLSAEAQARYVLDQLALDLESAMYRDDGSAWMAATILANTTNTGGSWTNTGTVGNGVKPPNAAGSLQFIATGNFTDNSDRGPRFGIAGTWLRFFTTKRGSNLGNATTSVNNTSAPVAVAYQIVRRASSATSPNNTDRRYFLHRSEVRPAAIPNNSARSGTLQTGFNIVATAYEPASSSGVTRADPGEVRYPQLDSVVAENVVDFGVRLFTYVTDAAGKPALTRIFPTDNSDLTHTATLPPRISDASGSFTNCFPDVVDVMVRVLSDEGARLLLKYETGAVTAAPGRTAQQYWWDIALANSQVYTRRIVINARPL